MADHEIFFRFVSFPTLDSTLHSTPVEKRSPMINDGVQLVCLLAQQQQGCMTVHSTELQISLLASLGALSPSDFDYRLLLTI